MPSISDLDERGRSFAFATALLVNFVDQLGSGFLIPIIYPLGDELDADDNQIAFWSAIRGFFMLFSTIGLSALSDLTSRRLAVMISIAGSGLSYAIQAYAASFGLAAGATAADKTLAIWIFTIGRAVAGAFAGTSPVLRAFVSDLYDTDPSALKQRLSTMNVASMGLGLALSPIAGSIANAFGLVLPVQISIAASVFGLVWAVAFFPTAARPKAGDDDDEAKELTAGTERAAGRRGLSHTRNPYCDPAVLIFGLVFAIMATMFSGALGLMLPKLLLGEPFNYKAREVSQVQGLLSLPNGIAQLFVTIMVYPAVTDKFGDALPLGIAGCFASVGFFLTGEATQLWMLFGTQTIIGIGFGMIFPAVAPLMSKYAAAIYPQTKAQVQAIPMMGMSVGMMLGQVVVAQIPQDWAWTFAGALCLAGTVFLVCGIKIVERALADNEHELEDLEGMTDDPHKFVDIAVERLREYLNRFGGENLKYRPMQALVLARLMNCVPHLPPFNPETKGAELREQMFREMGEFEGLRGEFADLFFDLGHDAALVADIHDMHGSDHSYNHNMMTMVRERKRRDRSSNPNLTQSNVELTI